jgi:hypothetical protein
MGVRWDWAVAGEEATFFPGEVSAVRYRTEIVRFSVGCASLQTR